MTRTMRLHKVACFAVAALLVLGAFMEFAPKDALASEANATSMSLTVKSQCGCSFVDEGQGLSIWRVAHVEKGTSLVPVDVFAEVSADWSVADAAAVRELADALEAHVEKEGIAPTAFASMDASGTVVFSDLEPSCYLIAGSRHKAGNVWHESMASLVMVPQTAQDGGVDCDPVVATKYSTVQKEEGNPIPSEDPKPNMGSKLPQTGQLWWPVAALLMAGVVLLAAGVSRKLRK